MDLQSLNINDFVVVLYYNSPSSNYPIYRLTYGPVVKIEKHYIHYNPWIVVDDEFADSFSIKRTTSIMLADSEMIITKSKFSLEIMEKIAKEKYGDE